MARGAFLVVFVLTLPAFAQPSTSAASAGACAEANWVCVAECIDRRCANRCLEGACANPLAELKQCTVKAACPGDDPQCARERCGPRCLAAFGRAAESQLQENADPCAQFPGDSKVPKELVGGWNLSAASIEPVETRPGTDPSPQPRADYELVLEVKPNGCFVLSGKLEDETLGQGNHLVVRGWGKVTVEGKRKKTVRLETQSGQAVGTVCSRDRVIDLAGGKFKGPRYEYSVEAGMLTLTSLDADKQTFQFQNGPPQKLDETP